jgi:hypothetical protein
MYSFWVGGRKARGLKRKSWSSVRILYRVCRKSIWPRCEWGRSTVIRRASPVWMSGFSSMFVKDFSRHHMKVATLKNLVRTSPQGRPRLSSRSKTLEKDGPWTVRSITGLVSFLEGFDCSNTYAMALFLTISRRGAQAPGSFWREIAPLKSCSSGDACPWFLHK